MARIVSRCRVASGLIGAFVTAALFEARPARAFPEWATQHPIPNLDAAGGCDGLCHVDGYPGSALTNPLYLDFEAAGFVWNAKMANDDSDGDGFSNGWELQNPSGTWVAGTADPGSAALVSNPTLSNARPPLPVAIVLSPC